MIHHCHHSFTYVVYSQLINILIELNYAAIISHYRPYLSKRDTSQPISWIWLSSLEEKGVK